MVILEYVSNDIDTVLITNSRVLSVVFLGVVTGFCINKLGEQILVVKKLLTNINNIITVFLNFVIFNFTPIAMLALVS